MSASLVGSEMCIRDSRPTQILRTAAGGLLPLPGLPDWRSKCAAGGSWGAVSYTHLTLPTICSV
eukprot:4362403-Alexandrium_andersonii.AAC.1